MVEEGDWLENWGSAVRLLLHMRQAALRCRHVRLSCLNLALSAYHGQHLRSLQLISLLISQHLYLLMNLRLEAACCSAV